MKKVLLIKLCILFLAVSAISQEVPCPSVSGIHRTNVINNGNGTCSATITFHAQNDVSDQNPKGIMVEVFCGTSIIATLSQCFQAPPSPGADLTTNSFSCPCNASITIQVSRFTASNGSCQGQFCGPVLTLQETPLPVNYYSFTAKRNDANVALKWETASEQNNTGFAVESKTSGGDWREIGFVATQAQGGNSSSILSYAYTDPNNSKEITEYRIKQIDIDGRNTFSETRMVRGMGQPGKTTIYPNPSTSGKINMVFEDGDAKDVWIIDMTGRIVKQWKAIMNDHIEADIPSAGLYTLKVVNRETGEQSMNKFVINR